jgi:hypothetical protein
MAERLSFHIEDELYDVGRITGIVRSDGHGFDVFTGLLSGFNLDFDIAGLTRTEDFREVHSSASSTWHH